MAFESHEGETQKIHVNPIAVEKKNYVEKTKEKKNDYRKKKTIILFYSIVKIKLNTRGKIVDENRGMLNR